MAQHNHGVALQELGQPRDALAAFERAVAANPRYAAAFYGLGLAYLRLDALDAALLAFECAIECDGKDFRYPLERARTLIQRGRHADALAALDTLQGSDHEAAEVQNLRGIALKNLQRPDEALAAYGAAISKKPGHAEALNNRGNLLLRQRRFTPALADFDRAMALQPGMDWLRGTRLYTAAHVFAWSDYAQEVSRISAEVTAGRRCVQPLALQCLVDDPALHRQAARIWSMDQCAPKGETLVVRAPDPDRRTRIAYVSRDFKSHPVSFLMAEVFELHDRERFEIMAFNYGAASQDPMQARLRPAFDHFLDVEALGDAEIAQLARSLKVDIAIDLTGFTDGARSGIFAWRCAPIQVSYLGYLGSAGSTLYDYLLADDEIIPEALRAHFDERIAYLPSYQANDRQRPRPAPTCTREAVGLPASGFVYCCFNNPCKITPETFAAWMRILAQVPDAVLWVLDEGEHAAENLRAQARQAGIGAERLVFAPRASREDYLAKLALADLFLDTLPYNAGTTASDALWMGLPVLTLQGRSFAGRMASSLLKAAGLPDLVTKDAEGYVTLAVQLAQDGAMRAALRARLHDARLGSRLFDTPRFTRSLEQAYVGMLAQRQADEPLRDITVAG